MDYEVFIPDDRDEFLDEMCAANWDKMFGAGWDIYPDSEEVDEQCLCTS